MKKKIWTAPEISVVHFAANEYVTACGAPNTYWQHIGGKGHLLFEADEDPFTPDLKGVTGGTLGTGDHNIAHNYAAVGLQKNPGTYDYFNAFTDAVKDPSSINSSYTDCFGGDQLYYVSHNDHLLSGCGQTSTTAPTTETFDGWFTADLSSTLWQKVLIWWQGDAATGRMHMASQINEASFSG